MEIIDINDIKISEIIDDISTNNSPDEICKKYNIDINIYNIINNVHNELIHRMDNKITEIKKDTSLLRKKYRQLWIDKSILQEALEGKL